MATKILSALLDLGVTNPDIITVFEEWDDSNWIIKLIDESPFLCIISDYLSSSKDFNTISKFLTSSSFAVSIFFNSDPEMADDYKFLIIKEIKNIDITFYDGDTLNVHTLSEFDFITVFPDYNYSFTFILNSKSIYPDFELVKYKNDEYNPFTINLLDLNRYYINFYGKQLNFEESMVNIIAIRSDFKYNYDALKYAHRNTFQDFLILCYQENGVFFTHQFPFTTFPDTASKSLYPKKRSANDLGIAIVMEGLHNSVYKIGKHGKYNALRQFSDIPIYRDKSTSDDEYYELIRAANFKKDRYSNNQFPFVNLHTISPKSQSSGIVTKGKTLGGAISGYSAGCQVVALPAGNDWNSVVMKIFDNQKSKTNIDVFDYTIIEAWHLFEFLSI